jgi:hypothetical protein
MYIVGSIPAGTYALVLNIKEIIMHNPDWTYGHSDLLGMDFAFKQKPNGSLDVYTEDKTHYTQSELNTIRENHNDEYSKQVHIIKHMFDGIIIG